MIDIINFVEVRGVVTLRSCMLISKRYNFGFIVLREQHFGFVVFFFFFFCS